MWAESRCDVELIVSSTVQAPRVGGVKVYTDNIQRSEIIMDLEIFYAGDCRIECSFSRMSAGIKDFTVSVASCAGPGVGAVD